MASHPYVMHSVLQYLLARASATPVQASATPVRASATPVRASAVRSAQCLAVPPCEYRAVRQYRTTSQPESQPRPSVALKRVHGTLSGACCKLSASADRSHSPRSSSDGFVEVRIVSLEAIEAIRQNCANPNRKRRYAAQTLHSPSRQAP